MLQISLSSRTEDLGDGIELDMVLLPSGQFQMGAPETEEGHHSSEGPQHNVQVPSFYFGRYPITQPQWCAVVQTTPKINLDLDPYPSRFKGDRLPLESVSWFEAVEFCDRLSALTSRIYRLPSEAEWEYAFRAGTTTPFHFGNTVSTEIANYRGVDLIFGEVTFSGAYSEGTHGEFRERTTP
jgi:formylglycine-generating enzyme required for sulfatase activity